MTTPTAPTAAGTAAGVSSWQTFRRGLSISPEPRAGLAGALVLSMIAMIGRVAIPIAIQQILDRGLRAPGGPRVGFVIAVALATLAVLVVTALCSYLMMRRLFTVSETALANVRTRTFRH